MIHNITITMDSERGYSVYICYYDYDKEVTVGYEMNLSYDDIENVLLDVIFDVKNKKLN